LTLIENTEIEGPVIVGIGLPEDWAALAAAGAVDSYEPREANKLIQYRAFRAEDTLLLVRPKLLRPVTYKRLNEVSEGEGLFQVLGYEPVYLSSKADIDAFRELHGKVGKYATVIEKTGRRPDYTYTRQQAYAILKDYYAVPRIEYQEVKARAEKLLEQDLPDHWLKMLARKYFGNTRRTAPLGWEQEFNDVKEQSDG